MVRTGKLADDGQPLTGQASFNSTIVPDARYHCAAEPTCLLPADGTNVRPHTEQARFLKLSRVMTYSL